jgi:Ni/Co efflux regulator RcnB
MSDTYSDWEDPWTDPWFQGQPTQQDIYANRYGQGFGNSGYDSPQDEVDARFDQLKEYLKMQQAYIPDLIPGIPDFVEKPEYDKPVFRSDFVSSNQGDKALNEVYRIVQSGRMGLEEAISAVLGMAEESGWAMPLEMDQGDRLMNYDSMGNPVVQYTQDQYNQATAAGIDLSSPQGRGLWGSNEPDSSGQVLPPAPANFNETLFRENAIKFVQESEQQNREQGARDATMAEYQDFIAPRYSFDYQGMMENGASAGLRKTDYYAREQTPAETRSPGRPRGTAAPVRQSRPRSDRRGGGVETRTQNFERDQRAADRTNEKNRSDNEKFQAAYRANLTEYAQGQGALPSKAQQHRIMIDDYLASVIYGGGQ